MATNTPHPAAVARTTPEARRGRSPVERLTVRFPTLTRRIVGAALGPRRIPGRDALIDYTYRRAYAAFNRRDWELNTLLHHPRDFVLRAGGGGLLMPDADQEYRGVDGYLEAILQWASGWRELKVRFERYVEVEPGLIVSLTSFVGFVGETGIEIDQAGADVQRFRNGYVVSQTFYWDRAGALRSVGLEPPGRRR